MFDRSPLTCAGSRSVYSGAFQLLVLGEFLLTEVNPGNGCDFGVKWPGTDVLTVVVDDIDSRRADAVAWRIEFQQLHNSLAFLGEDDGKGGGVLVQSTKARFRMCADRIGKLPALVLARISQVVAVRACELEQRLGKARGNVRGSA